MSVRLSLATLIALSAFAVPTQADILASAPLYGGGLDSPGSVITCRIFNAGSSSATISQRQIRTNTNALMGNSADSCNVVLGPLKYCAFTANSPGNLAFTCRIVASGTNLKLRGVAEMVKSAKLIAALPME